MDRTELLRLYRVMLTSRRIDELEEQIRYPWRPRDDGREEWSNR